MTISQTVRGVRERRLVGEPNTPCFMYGLDHFDSLINVSPQASQVGTIVVDTSTNSATYTWTINGEVMTYTADSSTSKIEIAAGITDVINQTPAVRGAVSAATDGVDTVTVTGLYPGVAFTASDADAKLTTTEAATAAAESDVIPFGRFVAITQSGTAEGPERYCALPTSAALSAQVDTITVDYSAGERYTVAITIDGIRRTIDVLADTDDATTATAIRAAINAIMPAASVVATGGTDQVILTAEVEGKAFVTDVGLVSGTIARLALVNTTAAAGYDLAAIIGGISILALDEETIPQGGGDPTGYPANAGVRVLRQGDMWVETVETPTMGAPVYVETTAGATAGRPYVASSATRIKLPTSIASWQRNVSGDGLAVIRINLPLV